MTDRKKLIEVALPLEAINEASAREKSIRHGHPSTLHLWWARRPLAAARAVIFTSLVDDPDDPAAPPEFIAACRNLPRGKNAAENDTPRQRLFDFIETLVKWESTTDEAVLKTARRLINLSTGGNPPSLLDPFAGGGSIPLEAQRLGLEAHASDLNPVAVMINKALIEIPPKFANRPPVNPTDRAKMGSGGAWKGAAGLAADVRYYGKWMRDRAFERIGHLYPDYTPPPQSLPPSGGGQEGGRIPSEGGSFASPPTGGIEGGRKTPPETVIAWLWARTVTCPNPACRAQMPLVSTFWLSKKKNRKAWVEPVVDHATNKVRFTVKTGEGAPPAPPKVGRGAKFKCLVCGEIAPDQHIKDEGIAGRMGAQLMAIVTEGNRGRNYHAPTPEHEQIAAQAKPEWLPQGELADEPRAIWCKLYGLIDFADLFTPRQLTALTTFSDLVAEARAQIEADARAAWETSPPQPSPVGGGSDSSQSLPPSGGGWEGGKPSSWAKPHRGKPDSEAKIWTPTPVPPELLEAARRLRRNMTDAEQLLWQCLRKKQLGGFRFRKQHPIERFVLDFYCPAARLAVEVDGGQHNTPEGIAKDEERTAILEQHGIKVIRFWNNDVMENLEGVLQTIYDELQGRTETPPPQPSPVGGGSDSTQSLPPSGGGWEGGKPLRDGGTGPTAYAEAVSVYLAFAVDRSADFWGSLAFWANQPKNEVVAHIFGRQALPMVWDYAEVNIFSSSGGNWLGNLKLIAKGIDKSVSNPVLGSVFQEDVTQIKGYSEIMISTDPPYYDNIGYADLSDFFYAWLRPALRAVYPDIFATLQVPKTPELIASPYRFDGDKKAAERHFETGLQEAFAAMRRIITPNYPLTVYYAFKQQEVVAAGTASTGWETMLSGLIESGFQIVGTWPIRTERSGRMIASGTNALASSIVLVCRPRPDDAPLTTRREFINTLRRELPAAIATMQSGNIAPVDMAQAAIGPGMAVYSRYSRVLEPDGKPLTVRAALRLINQELDAYLSEQEGDIDRDTRFAVAWFEQNGFGAGDFGTADVLARAKNTSIGGLVNAGVVRSGAGKVQLVPWRELDPGWDPRADSRPTVWEATHHLIERLNTHGESGAAMLLAKMSSDLAASARQLAYRLYSICERKGWTEHARDYNALVVSWNASQSQAVKLKDNYQQGGLFD